MRVKQSLSLYHVDNKKQREWDFYEYEIAGKLLELLKKNFRHHLYESYNEGLDGVKSEIGFEITLFSFKHEGDEIAVITPNVYFRNEGYSEIVRFIDEQYKKIK